MQSISELKARFLHSGHFCCCIPVRAGFVLITVLSFFLSGTVSIIIWLEVYSFDGTTFHRVAFVLTGVVESILCLASSIGFIGVVARKQLFVMIYTYFLYVHFFINVIVGIYFLVTVRASNRSAYVGYCSEALANTSYVNSCTDLTRVSTYVFIAIVVALLFLELYGVLIAARYVYRLRKQKRDNRSRRLGYFHVLSQPESPNAIHTHQGSDDIELLHNVDGLRSAEDAVLDIRPPEYMPVSMHDHDLPPVPPPLVSPLSPSSDTTSSRRIRALPPRPNTGSPLVTRAPEPERLPNPHAPRKGRVVRRRDSDSAAEVSTAAHSALMDHATYMTPVFARPR